MKEKITLFFLCGWFIFSANAQFNRADLTGTWRGIKENNAQVKLVFYQSDSIQVMYNGALGPVSKFVLDTSKNPYWLDITYSIASDTQITKCLLQVVNKTTLKIQFFLLKERQDSFLTDDRTNPILTVKKSQ